METQFVGHDADQHGNDQYGQRRMLTLGQGEQVFDTDPPQNRDGFEKFRRLVRERPDAEKCHQDEKGGGLAGDEADPEDRRCRLAGSDGNQNGD